MNTTKPSSTRYAEATADLLTSDTDARERDGQLFTNIGITVLIIIMFLLILVIMFPQIRRL